MLRQATKTLALQIPAINRLVRQRDELLAKVESFQAPPVASKVDAVPAEKWDHSQNGEFGLLAGAMIQRTVEHTFVVDVGAYGRSGSNSYDLMRRFGWRGLLIEPNPYLLEKIKTEFDGVDYKLVNVAAAGYNGEATLHLGVHDEISSIQRHQTEHWGPVHETVTVAAERLPEILQRNGVPHAFGLLSIDAGGEGFNLFDDALAAGYRPTWVIIEVYKGLEINSLDETPASAEIKKLYRIEARTFPNLILASVNSLSERLSYRPVPPELLATHRDEPQREIDTAIVNIDGRSIEIDGDPTDSYFLAAQEHVNGFADLKKIVQGLPAGSVIFDVGANIGLSALTMAVNAPQCRIIGFEPSPVNFPHLKRNVERFGSDKIVIHQVAVSNKQGVLRLFDGSGANDWSGGWSHVVGENHSDKNRPVEEVKAVRLDDLTGPLPALIKIDVEGHEPEVLAGAQRIIETARPLICVEFNAWTLNAYGGHSPAAFAAALFEAFEVEGWTNAGKLLHSILCHRELTDLVLRLKEGMAVPTLARMSYPPAALSELVAATLRG